MTAVIIGVDPAKRSHTIEVIDETEQLLAVLRVENTNSGYREMRAFAKRWADHRWAIEGARGVGRQLAQRLVADGERVVDVPAKLSTRARAFDTGHGRKNDPADAHAVAVVALRTTGLSEVRVDDDIAVLRVLSDRRRDLVRSRTQTVNRCHQLLMELIPAGAPKNLTATTARALVATVRPRDIARKARRAVVVDLIDDIVFFDRKLKAVEKQLAVAVTATGTSLTDIVGIGPVTAALILGEVGDATRFPTKHHFASFTGTAPLEASSGDVVRHRLSRAGNRRLNHALHMIALSHKKHDQRGRDYYARKHAAGKGAKGALRCLKRRLSDAVFRRLVDDQARRDREGHSGATLTSSAADLVPMTSTSDKPLPGLTRNPKPDLAAVS